VIFEKDSKLKRIDEEAFNSTGLKSVRIPATVEFIGEGCFCECKSLSGVIFEGNVEIGKDAFDECPVKDVKVPVGIKLNYPFAKDCRIEYVTVAVPKEQCLQADKIGHQVRDATPIAKGMSPNISDWIIDLSQDYERIEDCDCEGEIELFRHRKTGEEVAVKTLPMKKGANLQRLQDSFLREVSSLIELKHPCIVELKGCCLPRKNEGPKIITRFLGGGSLRTILEKGKNASRWFTGNRKAIIIAGIVLGMIYVHSKGLIHRDLKPANLFLDDEFRVQIGDFGSSRLCEFDVTLTVAGTPLYMAPEVTRGHYDQKADVYSFGLILYEMIVGNALFSGSGEKGALFIDLQKGWRPPIPSEVYEVSKRLIEECWVEDPKNRPSFADIWSYLEDYDFQLFPNVDPLEVKLFVQLIEQQKKREMSGGVVGARSLLQKPPTRKVFRPFS
jgi:serine/threonine protein kinase